MFCTSCGCQLDQQSRFCSSCGAEVAVDAATGSSTPSSSAIADFGAPIPVHPPWPSVQYGGFWRRFLATLIDGVVLWITYSLVSILFLPTSFFVVNSHMSETQAVEVGMAFLKIALIEAVIGWGYYAGMESSSSQATLGKMALGMRVTDLECQRISFMRATGRYFGKTLSTLILYIGFIMVGFTDKKQGLHDKLADTLVVKK